MSGLNDPYSRHYWRWADEYPELYEDDATCALWYRLVRLADMAWPAAGTMPYGVRPKALERLVLAGLIERVTNSTYRVRGMDKERARRSDSARYAARMRYGDATRTAGRTAGRTASGTADRTAERMPSRAEPIDEPSQASSAHPADPLDAYYRLTGSWPSQRVVPWLNELAADHGEAALTAALAGEWVAESSTKTLLSRTRDRLEREAHEGKQRRTEAKRKADAAEKARIEAMPPEQRQANLKRLRELAKANGLDLGGEA